MVKSVLLSYQQKWIADNSQVKIWEKSRRIGASWCEAFDNVCIASVDAGQNIWYISANKDMALEYIQDCAHWAKHLQTACSEYEEFLFEDNTSDGKQSIQAYRIKFASGKRITALSSRPTNLRGKQGVVVIDEAAFHEDLDGMIKASMALLMWGGKIRILSTHNGVENSFNELINEVRSGKKPYSLHRTTLNDALEQGLYERICLVTKKKYSKPAEMDWQQSLIDFYGFHADEELFCIPTNSSGAYFSRIMIEQCMSEDIPVVDLALDADFINNNEIVRRQEIDRWLKHKLFPYLDRLHPDYRSSYGLDFGRSNDLTYLLPLQEMPNLVRRAPFALQLRNVPYEQQKQILFYIVDRLPRFRKGIHDATGNGAFLAEQAATKFGKNRIEELKLSQSWYLENMPKYKSALEDKKILLPADSELLEDHQGIELQNGVAKPSTRKNSQRHSDGAVAAALAWAASCSDSIPVYPVVSSSSFRSW